MANHCSSTSTWRPIVSRMRESSEQPAETETRVDGQMRAPPAKPTSAIHPRRPQIGLRWGAWRAGKTNGLPLSSALIANCWAGWPNLTVQVQPIHCWPRALSSLSLSLLCQTHRRPVEGPLFLFPACPITSPLMAALSLSFSWFDPPLAPVLLGGSRRVAAGW